MGIKDWNIWLLARLQLRFKRNKVKHKAEIVKAIDNNKFAGNIRRVTLDQWKESMTQKGEKRCKDI